MLRVSSYELGEGGPPADKEKEAMIRSRNKRMALGALALTIAASIMLTPAPRLDAADHGDAPFVAQDQAVDIADVFIFLDPNDNSKVILAVTIHGFIVPNEAVNFGVFDPNVRYRFEVDKNGDPKPEAFVDVRFTPKDAASTQAQTATISFSGMANDRTFTAPSTVPNLNDAGPAPVITTDGPSGVAAFAGLVDDPFTFDITGFNRFVAAVRAGTANPAQFLSRGRDSFAGYNTLAIALSIPKTAFGLQGNRVGVHFAAQRRANEIHTGRGIATGFGRWVNIDRMATPAVNVALVPFSRKNEHNAATTIDDANGRFAADIVATLRALGTDDTSISILATLAVNNGDFLRLDTTVPNTGSQGGGYRSDTICDRNPNDAAGFPNGRRPGDDVIDTELFLINNRRPLTDNANCNDVPYRSQFPFFGVAHQPRATGVTDDQTRN